MKKTIFTILATLSISVCAQATPQDWALVEAMDSIKRIPPVTNQNLHIATTQGVYLCSVQELESMSNNEEIDCLQIKRVNKILSSGNIDINKGLEMYVAKPTILHHAVSNPSLNIYSRGKRLSNKKMIENLIQQGADINAKDTYGNTPLHYAARSNDFVAFKTLLENKADIYKKNNDGDTPAHLAAFFQNFSLVERLVEHGDKLQLENNDGKTAKSMLNFFAGGNSQNYIEHILEKTMPPLYEGCSYDYDNFLEG